MKTKLTLLFLLVAELFFAQGPADKKVYLDSTYTITTKDKHVYYRIVKNYMKELPEYSITQYYKSGEKESEGISTSKEYLKHKGVYTSYYQNGNKKTDIRYDETGYENGYCMGFYENGENKFEGVFITTTAKKEGFEQIVPKLRITNYWNKDKVQTVTDGNGDYLDDGYFDNLIKNSVSYGKLVNGFKDGIWTGLNEQLRITFAENYTNGKLLEGKSIDKSGNEYPYGEINLLAKPMGGIASFYKFVGKNFNTPENLKSKVTVITKFTVTTDNKLANVENINSVGKEADEEAIRVIKAFNNFTCAKFRGLNVKSTFTLPITMYATE
jgi:antitoxin component YwqK of YwqJK toxin-antitoxin module